MDERRLLVVDDEADFAEVVRKVGERQGFTVEVLTDSREFEEVYERFRPTTIMLDIIMPDVDGIEIVQWLAKNGNKAKVIVATGYNPDFARAARGLALARGQFEVATLNKPVSMADLRAALD